MFFFTRFFKNEISLLQFQVKNWGSNPICGGPMLPGCNWLKRVFYRKYDRSLVARGIFNVE